MNELFKVNADNERITISARELHENLKEDDKGQERFSKWFERMLSYGFEEGQDFSPYQMVHPQNKQEYVDYQITIDMAKEIAMLQRNEKGKEIRQKLIQLEKDWNSPQKVMARALVMAQKEIETLRITNEEMKPKAEFFDAVADSKTAIPMGEVAKVLDMGIGRNKLFEILRQKGVLMNNNIPYQKHIDNGYFRVIETKYTKPDGDTAINIKTLVYQKGINYIKKIIEKENKNGK